MLFIGSDPDLLAGVTSPLRFAHLDLRPIVDHDPKFGPSSVRLQAEPLPGLHDHQAHRTVAIVRKLLERPPRSFDCCHWRLLSGYGFIEVVHHNEMGKWGSGVLA